MMDNAGALYILNGKLEESHNFAKLIMPAEGMVYEVIRVIEGVPLFFEDHYARMKDSLGGLREELDCSQQELKRQIRQLVEQNKLVNCNAKLVVYRAEEGRNLLLYISKSYYPDKEEADRGVRVCLMQLERDNPNMKLLKDDYRKKVSDKLESSKAFEVLLVNKDSKITEGSKSNVFFVKGNKVYTAPGEYVLRGITRQYVIDTCERLGFEVIRTLIGVDSLKDMDGLFISGTSIKVLPVGQVDDILFNSGSDPTISAVRELYDGLLNEYIRNNK